jgi:hypothetical protein
MNRQQRRDLTPQQQRSLSARIERACDQEIDAVLAHFGENGITPTPGLIEQVAYRRALATADEIETEIREGRCPEMWETPKIDEAMLLDLGISRQTYLQIVIMAQDEWLEHLREVMKLDTSKYPARDSFVPELGFTYRQVFFPKELRPEFHRWMQEEYIPRLVRQVKQQSKKP